MTYLDVDVTNLDLPAFSYKAGMERLPAEQIRSMQLERLQPFLERVYDSNEFFRARFDDADVKPDDIKSWDDFKRLIPFINKQEVLEDQRQHPPYGKRLGVPREKLRVMQTTSGTTGIGQEVYGLTASDAVYEGLNTAQCLQAQGVTPGDHVGFTFPISTSSAGQCALEGVRLYGAVIVLLGLYDAETKLSFLRNFRCEYMISAPAYLTRLSVLAKELGLDPRKDFGALKSICVATEAFPVSWTERMGDFWGTPIHELYGSTQQGSVVGYTCSSCTAANHGRRGLLHLPEWMCIFELLDPTTNEEVGPGEEGELILTTFAREASPLVRFRTGDLMIRADTGACTSGRTTLATQAGTITRIDDMIKIKASNVWPAAVDNLIFAYEETDEYNARVYLDETGAEKVEIRLEFKPGETDQTRKDAVIKELIAEIRNRTAVTMAVVEVPHGTVERFEWKPKRWKDQRMEGLDQVSV